MTTFTVGQSTFAGPDTFGGTSAHLQGSCLVSLGGTGTLTVGAPEIVVDLVGSVDLSFAPIGALTVQGAALTGSVAVSFWAYASFGNVRLPTLGFIPG